MVLLVIAVIFWSQRKAVPDERPEEYGFWDSISLLKRPRVLFGVIGIFTYVGAEVSIGSVLVELSRTADRARRRARRPRAN